MSPKRIKHHQKKGQKNTPKNNDPISTNKGPQGDQNTTDKGGKGRDPGWNPPRKKKNIAKTRLTAGKGCMREGNTQDTPNANTLRWAESGPGANFSMHFGRPLPHFWLPLGSRWLPLGSLWFTFGSLLGLFFFRQNRQYLPISCL